MAHDTFRELRAHLDGQDPFMTQGHQILKIRRTRKKTPSWVYNKTEIRKFLVRAFPKMGDPDQRKRAGRWVRIAQLYFNQNWGRGQIAAELHLTYNQVNSIIRSLKRAAAGQSCNSGCVPKNPKGRPRKVVPA